MPEFQKFDLGSKVLVTWGKEYHQFEGWVSWNDATGFNVTDKYGEEKMFMYSESDLHIAVLQRSIMPLIWSAGKWERTQGDTNSFLRHALQCRSLTFAQEIAIQNIINEREADNSDEDHV